jgi:hypothetical protein
MPDRYRPYPPEDDPRDRRHPQQHADSDPLAELARLIGQTDPFSNFGREHAATSRSAPRDQSGYAADDGYQQDYNRSYDPPFSEPEQAYDQNYDEPPSGPPSWVRNTQQQLPVNGHAANGHAYGYDERDPRMEQGYDAPPFAREDHAQQPGFDRRFEQPQDPQSRYEDVLYGERPDPHRPDPRYDHDPRYDDPYADDGYAEEPQVKPRRGGTMTVMVVLALAVIGTAGAYAYRSFVGSPRSGEPPIIRADAGPNKIVPPSGDKQIYDRVGDRTGERVVSREEQPVDVNGQPSGPRVVFPPLSQNASPPTTSTVSPDSRPTGPGVANGSIGEEPRKIKTLTIRPDQPDGTMSASVPATAPSASVPPARSIPMTGTRSSPPPSASPQANAPMAITPQVDQTPPPAVAAPRARVASVNPSASAPSAGGSYVQISSQKTEADALASYKVLQGKYSGILGSRTPVVRRADLGDKGVFYRALVGPFSSTDEATQFCVNFQSAGGKCIVQRN